MRYLWFWKQKRRKIREKEITRKETSWLTAESDHACQSQTK